MATNRILEFTPSQEEAIVARILVLLHQAVDENFPAAEKANRQFTKTVFSDDDVETTAIGSPQDPGARGFGSEEKTDPGNRPPDAGATPTRAPKAGAEASPASPAPGVPLRSSASQPSALQPAPTAPHSNAGGDVQASSGVDKKAKGPSEGRDWISLVTLALLIAGLILLAYSFLV